MSQSSFSSSDSDLNQQHRQRIKEMRLKISAQEQQAAGLALTYWLDSIVAFQTAKKIAGYYPVRGEISTLTILQRCFEENMQCYLPIIHTDQVRAMSFCGFDPNDPLQQGAYEIPAPVYQIDRCVDPQDLDIVLVPLMAFDRQGHRLGCGAGYYDTCFEFKQKNPKNSPLLIGLAYEFQEVTLLEPHPWDVTLDLILTPDGPIYPVR